MQSLKLLSVFWHTLLKTQFGQSRPSSICINGFGSFWACFERVSSKSCADRSGLRSIINLNCCNWDSWLLHGPSTASSSLFVYFDRSFFVLLQFDLARSAHYYSSALFFLITAIFLSLLLLPFFLCCLNVCFLPSLPCALGNCRFLTRLILIFLQSLPHSVCLGGTLLFI